MQGPYKGEGNSACYGPDTHTVKGPRKLHNMYSVYYTLPTRKIQKKFCELKYCSFLLSLRQTIAAIN